MTHYFSEKQHSKPAKHAIEALLRGNRVIFVSASGTFSKKRIDAGTRLLIEKSLLQDGWKVLDLGCGYGPVGIAVAKAFPKAEVVMTDVNERAVALAQDNVKLNKLGNARVLKGSLYNPVAEEKFHAILLNPPMAAGRKLCFEMIEKSVEHLVPGGLLELVARHNKGGRMLEEKMKEVFGNVEQLAKKSGYRVYVSALPKSP